MTEVAPSLGHSQVATRSRRKFSFPDKRWKPYAHLDKYRICNSNCNPWPCTSLQCAAKIIAIVEFAVTILLIIPIVVAAIYGIKRKSEDSSQIISSADYFKIIIVGLIIIPCVTIILDILLYFGAVQRSQWKCCVYFFTTIIIHTGEIILATIVGVISAKEENILLQVGASFTLIFQIIQTYFKRVVLAVLIDFKSRSVQPVPEQFQVESAEPEAEGNEPNV